MQEATLLLPHMQHNTTTSSSEMKLHVAALTDPSLFFGLNEPD